MEFPSKVVAILKWKSENQLNGKSEKFRELLLKKKKLDLRSPILFSKLQDIQINPMKKNKRFSVALTCISNDVFGPWVLGVAPADQFLHFINVKRRYNLGKG